jgi:Fe-S-cluster containining protein
MLQAFMELKQIYKGFDEGAKYIEGVIKTPICIEKCGMCCKHNTVPSTTIEALYAASILTGTGIVEEAVRRSEDWLLKRHPEALSYEGMVSGRFVPAKNIEELHALQSGQCPFLGDDMNCTIWAGRPAVCRAYGVTRGSGGFCPRPLGYGESASKQLVVSSDGLRKDWEDFKLSTGFRNPEWMKSGLLPTMIYRAARNADFYRLIKENRIASAKIIGMNIDMNIMWQPQVDAIEKGMDPELALVRC